MNIVSVPDATLQSNTGPKSWYRVDGIDLLRGLAIFFVLMNHINMMLRGAKIPYTKGWPIQLTYSLIWNGQFAVQMFFVISGFLITATTLRRWGSLAEVKPKDFYRLRFARIFPLLALLLALLSLLHILHVEHFVVDPKAGGLPRALFAALTFHINWLEAKTVYLPPCWDILWSLSVEEMFYLFFPIACILFRRTRYLVIPLVLFIIAGPFARNSAFNPNPVWREYSYLGGMDAIALGCLVALLLHRRTMSQLLSWVCLGLGTILLVFSLCFSIRAYIWGLGKNGLNMTILAFGAALLIAFFAEREWHAPKLLYPLLLAGKRSYEVYLTHEFIVILLFAGFMALGKPSHGIAALFAITITLAVIVGAFVARCYSEPLNQKLRRRFSEDAGRLGSVVEDHGK